MLSLILPIALIFIAVYLWMNLVATISLCRDGGIEPFQRYAQILLIWLIPYVGSALILFLMVQISPDKIPRKMVPWPFRSLIFGRHRPSNTNRDDNDGPGIDLAINSRQHSAEDYPDN